MQRLLIATNNAGKIEEYRELLAGCGWEVVSPSDIGLALEIEEDGGSYAENARLKAQAFARASGLACIGDDSGLEVDALHGEPGVFHYQKGWDGTSDADRFEIILRAMVAVPVDQRAARFRSYIVLILPNGNVFETEGVREGAIAASATAGGGYGYDTVFYAPSVRKTMAQLTRAEKNKMSHRALAVREIRRILQSLIAKD